MPDRLHYLREDGTIVELFPSDGTAVSNRDVFAVDVLRDAAGTVRRRWVLAADVVVAEPKPPVNPFVFGDPVPDGVRCVYVAPNGEGDGSAPDKPLADLTAAAKLAGTGPARLYLAHGGRWSVRNLDAPTHGIADYRRASAPVVRPRIYGTAGLGEYAVGVRHHTATLTGLYVQSLDGDPRVAGFTGKRARNYGVQVWPGVNLVARDCTVRFFGANVRLGDDGGNPTGDARLDDCVIADAWGPDDDPEWDRFTGQGVYGAYRSLRCTRTLFLNNGWTPDTLFAATGRVGNGFRHHLYLQHRAGGVPAEFDACGFVGAGGYAIQGRVGAVVRGSIFEDSGTHFGGAGATMQADGCYFGRTHAVRRKRPDADGYIESGHVGAWLWAGKNVLTNNVFAGIRTPVSILRRTEKGWTPAGRMSLTGDGNAFVDCLAVPETSGAPDAAVTWGTRPATDADRALAARVAAFDWRNKWTPDAVARLLAAAGD